VLDGAALVADASVRGSTTTGLDWAGARTA
jgi:hypothetical protein